MSPLIEHFDLLAASLGGVAKLRELILSLAVRGLLVPQDPNDEPASVLLQKIRAEKDRLIAEGKIKRDKKSPLAPLLQRGVTTKPCANTEAAAQTPPFAKGGAGGIGIADDEQPYDLPERWEWIRLADMLPEFQNGASSRGDEGGIATVVLRLADIKNRRISFSETRTIPITQGDVGKYGLIEGDVLIVRVNGSADIVGQFIPVDADLQAIYCDHFIRMRVDAEWCKTSYLCLLGQTRLIRDKISGLFITTAGQKTVNQGHIGSLLIALPPLVEQARIVAKVEELMALCDRLEAEQGHAARLQGHWVQAALDQLAGSSDADGFRRHWQHLASHFDTLFTTPESITALEATLLQLAVRGKLVAQDPKDEPASELLKRIRAEKDRLILEGKNKRDKPLPPISDDEKLYELPAVWEWVRLGDLTSLITKGSSPKWQGISYTEDPNDVLFVTSENVGRRTLLLEKPKYVQREFNDIEPRSILQYGDFLMNIVGASIGRTAIFDINANANINQAVCLIRTLPGISSAYMLLFFNTDTCVSYMFDKQVDNARANLSMGNITNFLIPLPPLAEQTRIVAQVEKLLALTAELKTRLASAQARQAQLTGVLIEDVLTC